MMPPRLLVVEDEPNIAQALRNDLRYEGYDVELQGDGDEAFHRAKSATFDLIVLDVMLPGRDGFAVCRELRRAGVQTPIIMLTARTQEVERVMGLELGADDYISKPFSPLELCARIKAVLRRSKASQAEVCRFGDVEVNFARGQVTRGGQRVELTPLELKLLGTLIRADGRLLSRDQIIDSVWGPGIAITNRVVDNHILHLRRKLEANPASPRYLLNARGLGYRFDSTGQEQTES
jgi:DNA-binding response OmpR family regulator